jgi:hypothetical protein
MFCLPFEYLHLSSPGNSHRLHFRTTLPSENLTLHCSYSCNRKLVSRKASSSAPAASASRLDVQQQPEVSLFDDDLLEEECQAPFGSDWDMGADGVSLDHKSVNADAAVGGAAGPDSQEDEDFEPVPSRTFQQQQQERAGKLQPIRSADQRSDSRSKWPMLEVDCRPEALFQYNYSNLLQSQGSANAARVQYRPVNPGRLLKPLLVQPAGPHLPVTVRCCGDTTITPHC